ncbi:MAG: circularly permuted type 2 ATP-grasp protein [Proteobacteria bacterium]|nr:circularly permuted type 2 ATP-grasp protein [Pseudomonadota bacterium]
MLRALAPHYTLDAQRFDEMFLPDGAVRPHWRPFVERLRDTSPAQMRERAELAQRRIRENGVTYNVYADPGGADRPWSLDPLPLIVEAAEWATLAGAVAQRARLLNLVLADLYGPQTLLAQGLIPPALVYGQHGFLWPCQGVQPPGGVWLHQYGVDLARSPDGRWWAIADRTQAPSGAGYALEDRLIVSRAYPELFRDLRVAHLTEFFSATRAALARYAPVAPGEQPLVALWTPGPANETYFEHVYLARHLGFPLVEGSDLTVRGDTVYLKSLRGLQRVHALMRRQDDVWCDPLELRGDSALGVPGLLGAVRAGRVLVANALGSGVVASQALMGFLPALCEQLLGEPLAMPSVATWWCGEASALAFVRAHLGELVIKPAYPSQQMLPVFGHELDAGGRADLLARIEARPHAYVAQEMVQLAQAPTWQDDGLAPRICGLRAYAAATPQGYAVMPGGLGRVAGGAQAHVLSMQRGGSSKDVWVLQAHADDSGTLLKPSMRRVDLQRGGLNLSSRVVEGLFWLGRYTERMEVAARMLRAILGRVDYAVGEAPAPTLRAALAMARVLGVLPVTASHSTDALAAVFDEGMPGGVAATVQQVLRTAARLRDRFSLDHWHTLTRLQHDLMQAQGGAQGLAHAHLFLDRVLTLAASLSGFTMDNMTRDEGWRFLMLGRRIERLDFVATAVATFVVQPTASAPDALDWLLELLDSSITYRSRYMRAPELLPVIDLAVFDAGNPRSVQFQVLALRQDLAVLRQELRAVPQHGVVESASALDEFDLDDLPGSAPVLARQLQALIGAARHLADQLDRRFFTHTDAVRTRQTMAV